MKKEETRQKIEKLEAQLKKYQERLVKTLAKSNDIFRLGGDGWHDNPAYDLMNADVDKICCLMDELKAEIAELRKKAL